MKFIFGVHKRGILGNRDRRIMVYFWWIKHIYLLEKLLVWEERWGEVEKKFFSYLWKGQAPTRVVAFTWKLLLDQAPTRMNLAILNIIPFEASVNCVVAWYGRWKFLSPFLVLWGFEKGMEFSYAVVRVYVYYSSKFVCSLGMSESWSNKLKFAERLLEYLASNNLGDLECVE